ncbi:MAG TPA: phenylalanine--tRNA ligase beta subunit-related protein [Bacteroidaceae bacterium]|nr:phenylalanine--tRNA ligase beta subunit-related protein [Bacteroidaceae bacterium]
MHIKISSQFKEKCPQFKGAKISATIINTPYCEALWEEIDAFTHILRSTETTESIKNHPVIQATRDGYKACGKQPSRYRPSSEALRRRLLRNLDLYQIDTMVDIVNLVSLTSGHSIGGFDADYIEGDTLTLDIGKEHELYTGIGRGDLNIANMPVYRDQKGGVGTPTSDHERTKIRIETTHFLGLINGFDGNISRLKNAADQLAELLKKHASARHIDIMFYE